MAALAATAEPSTVVPAPSIDRGGGLASIRELRPRHGGDSLERRKRVIQRSTTPPVPSRPRGLRCLLPGAATLAALGAMWLGVGMLSAVQQPRTDVLPGSVRTNGGYLYVARPGDSLWGIAARLQPGGDPRPIVERLQAQLHDATLLPGDRLILP